MCKNEDDYILDDIYRELNEKPSNKTKEVKPSIIKPKEDIKPSKPIEEVKPSIIKSVDNQEKLISNIENRFKEASGLEGDMDCPFLTKENHMQVKTDKEKSDKHGEVFTPLWLVDKMLDQFKLADWRRPNLTTFDLCSGYGQFTIRMLRRRYLYLKECGKSLNIPEILSEYHLFAEIQPGSCFRLLYIFGTKIRLLIGDVTEMGKLPDDAEHGIWVFNKGQWKDRTDLVVTLFNKYNKKEFGSGSVSDRAEAFEKRFNSFKSLCEKRNK